MTKLSRDWMTPAQADAAALVGVVEKVSTHSHTRERQSLATHRLPLSFWRSLAEMPPAHRLGQGAFFRERTDHGRRKSALPSLDFYDNLDGFARASIACNRVWFGWMP